MVKNLISGSILACLSQICDLNFFFMEFILFFIYLFIYLFIYSKSGFAGH